MAFMNTDGNGNLDLSAPTPAQQFEDLLQPHFDALHAAAQRMTLSSSDAEDLVQDVCLKIYWSAKFASRGF